MVYDFLFSLTSSMLPTLALTPFNTLYISVNENRLGKNLKIFILALINPNF